MVAGEPLAAFGPCGAHPVHADGGAQHGADLLVADRAVEHDGQDVVQQGLPVLGAFGPLGQGLGDLLLRRRLPTANRLVEQQQRLVEHVDGRLRQQREQDRVPALRLAPFFAGLDLVDPGLTPLHLWRPDSGTAAQPGAEAGGRLAYAGVARKP
ncbi:MULTISPECIES: SAM-dependent methyltransferase [unclassified Frankia]|uniref:SAM-dependent methyltransferase n=1 Tax=unclassified Frankia TaxID=2632575 RepID=UPI0027DD29A8|nr:MULTISPECIES: SAM-dependent methyltransferase [unclassified Frankia]